MKIITDNTDFVNNYFQENLNWQRFASDDDITALANEIFDQEDFYENDMPEISYWNYLFMVETANSSQYDILNEYAKTTQLPDKILAIAGSGKQFHGFRNRKWESLRGNIHLSVYLKPETHVKSFGAGFIILAAVSVLQTIDSIPQLKGKTGLKWVNDILIDDAKVSGVLAQTQLQGYNILSAILGIGLNVESTPQVMPDSYIPKAACINDFLADQGKVSEKDIFLKLIEYLSKNYKKLLGGKYQELLDIYRMRSVIIGREARLISDPLKGEPHEICRGKVSGIGENLELYFEGDEKPYINGRLILEE